VQKLVAHYDVDGDGNISLEEFTHFLLSRNAQNCEDWVTLENLREQSKLRRGSPSTSLTQSGSVESMDKGARAFLPNSEAYYDDEENNAFLENVPGQSRREDFEPDFDPDARSELGQDSASNEEALLYQTKVFLGNVNKVLVAKAKDLWRDGKLSRQRMRGPKATYNNVVEDVAKECFLRAFRPFVVRNGHYAMSFDDFTKTLLRFKNLGARDPSEQVFDALFNAVLLNGEGGSACQSNDVVEDVNPELLLRVVFDKGGRAVNAFGFAKNVRARTDTGRPEVAQGPILKTSDRRDRGGKPLRITDVPQRFLTRNCRTSLPAPSTFDMATVARSQTAPSYSCRKEHCYGLNTAMYSGSALLGLDRPGMSNQTLVYASASVAIVQDVSLNGGRLGRCPAPGMVPEPQVTKPLYRRTYSSSHYSVLPPSFVRHNAILLQAANELTIQLCIFALSLSIELFRRAFGYSDLSGRLARRLHGGFWANGI
jgi:hypothetical protein